VEPVASKRLGKKLSVITFDSKVNQPGIARRQLPALRSRQLSAAIRFQFEHAVPAW
jgi:hypothetical protein